MVAVFRKLHLTIQQQMEICWYTLNENDKLYIDQEVIQLLDLVYGAICQRLYVTVSAISRTVQLLLRLILKTVGKTQRCTCTMDDKNMSV